MAPSVGIRLGPYEILAPLGAGGMGEVFRASDTRLQRDVALKILSPEFANHPDRRARFEREARAVAALSHPNIVALYDIGEERGQLFMVSELVPGETLRSYLRKGTPLVRETIDIAVQIAYGISAAHEAGIAHRDLKPENLMLTADRAVKILDFGLARQNDSEPLGETDQTRTVHHPTKPGVVMGTPHYMSPEQARGQNVDYRSDQFSFGIILYEMLAGARPFERETTIQAMSAILTDDPPPLEAKIPAPLRWIVNRCLAKDPRQRYDSTRDLYHDLRNLREHLSEASQTASAEVPAATPTRKQGRLPWVAAAIATLLAVVTTVIAFLALTSPAGSLTGERYTPFASALQRQRNGHWSPDGGAVAYEGEVDGQSQVFLRYLNSPTATQLTHGPDRHNVVGWAADSKVIFMDGSTRGADGYHHAVYSQPVFGGEPEILFPLSGQLWSDFDVSRDGSVMAIIHQEPDLTLVVETSSPIGAPLKKYLPAPYETKQVGGVGIRFSPDGRQMLIWLFSRQSQFWRLPWPAGSAKPQRVLTNLADTSPDFSWMPDSRHLVWSHPPLDGWRHHLYLTDIQSGELNSLTGGTQSQTGPDVSPDGKKIVFTEQAVNLDIVSASLSDASTTKLIATERSEGEPSWAANQTRMAYVTDRNGPLEIWLRDADGSDRPLVTGAHLSADHPRPTLSPDGTRLVFQQGEATNASRLWIAAVSGSPPARLTSGQDHENYGAWSPDGSRFAFLHGSSGAGELSIVKTTGQAAPVRIRKFVGYNSIDWSPTGEWIAIHDIKPRGWSLVSPDGKQNHSLGEISTTALSFSKDGRQLYGVREDGTRHLLFAIDAATKKMRDIGDVGPDFRPVSRMGFSITPDGKSVTYTRSINSSSLWMLEGFQPPDFFTRVKMLA